MHRHRITTIFLSLLCVCLLWIQGAYASTLYPREIPILGGDPVDDGEFPWVVGLRYVGEREPFCGGSIIQADWILTAAHCFFEDDFQDTYAEDVEVFAGTVDLLGSGGESARVAAILHPGYDGVRNDIALLRLETPLPLTLGRIAPIAINSDQDYPLVGASVTIAGWGATEADGSGAPRTLQKVALPVAACDGFDDDGFTICAGGESGRDSCSGDSGGPLFLANDADWLQVGISSSGEEVCGLGSFYGLYTDVAPYSEWIDQTIRGGPPAVRTRPLAQEPYADLVGWAVRLIGVLFGALFLLGLFFYVRERRRAM